MRERVDIAVSAYGKPAQTAVALASLLQHSGQHIDTIFFQEELNQPHGDQVAPVLAAFPYLHIAHHRPQKFLGWTGTDRSQLHDSAFRQSIRYQYAWENTKNRYLFIFHNDCVFNDDIIGGMLARIGEGPYTGVGLIGQCWNCPAFKENLCYSDRRKDFRPDFAFVEALVARHPNMRTRIEMVDPAAPMPLPECRLNEFACLIDLGLCRADVMPLGDVVPFGFMALDVGTEWFRSMELRGHRFLHWNSGFSHAPFSLHNYGHGSDFSVSEYELAEGRALEHLIEHYPETGARLVEARRAAAAAYQQL